MNPYSFLLLIFFCQLFSCQESSIKRLSENIYYYNNNLQYKKSQDTLFYLLENNSLSASDKVEINILLSQTYKRLQDYTSVKYYLSKANVIAKDNELTALHNQINAQFAFAYFDTQDYKKAADIMRVMHNQKYRDLSADDKAKILMQEGYIHFRNGEFSKSQLYYKKAAALMQKNSDCDLPIIYGKQIQLYFSLNKTDQAIQYYRKGLSKAKQCKILKYEIYLAEVMMNLYKEKKDPRNTMIYTSTFDSLNKFYRPSENLQTLHLNRDLKAQKTEQDANKFKWLMMICYFLATTALCIVIYITLKYAVKTRKSNMEYLNQIESMKQTLMKQQAEKNLESKLKTKLNNKQMMMLEMMKDGKSNKEIGREFNITESTVKYHIKTIYETLNIRTRKDLKDII